MITIFKKVTYVSSLDMSEIVKFGLLERREFFSIYIIKNKGYCVMINHPYQEFESAYLLSILLGNKEFDLITDDLFEAQSYIKDKTEAQYWTRWLDKVGTERL